MEPQIWVSNTGPSIMVRKTLKKRDGIYWNKKILK